MNSASKISLKGSGKDYLYTMVKIKNKSASVDGGVFLRIKLMPDFSLYDYLFFQLLSELLGLALLVVVHDHHGSIDLPYSHVTGCEGESRNHQTIDMTSQD